MRFWDPFCRPLLSLVRGVCLPLTCRCQQQPLLLARLRCPLPVGRLLLVQPLRPLRPVDVSVLRSLPAQSGTMGGRLVGRGPARVGSVAGVGPLPLLALPIRPVLLPPPPLSPWSRRRRRRWGASALPPPPPVVLVQAVVALGVPAQRLAAPAPPSPVPRGWARVCGLRRALTGPAVSLHPLLRGWQKTAIVSLVPSIWTGMTLLGLSFASSGSSMAWRNWQA